MIIQVVVGLALTALITGVIDLFPYAASAQEQQNVSVVNLTVRPGSNGGQMVLTPRGILVPLPGAGVAGNVVEIYMGSKGGYWYTDRNGQTVDLTAYVQQIRAQSSQSQQAAPPQYAPCEAPAQSSGAGATAVAAGMGAMVGSVVANTGYYNHVPYGTPIYYGANGRPYYNDREGKNVFINEDGDVKWNNVYAANQIKTNNQTQKMDQLQQQRANTQSQSTQQQQQLAHQYTQQQSQHFQQQENWYQNQTQDKARAQTWKQQSAGENPFVRQSKEGAFGGERSVSRERANRGERAARSERSGGRVGGGRAGGGRRGP